ncbi:MAG: AMP-binding protein, partial [Clostridia bacterium]|nr:AMP-binding protein [Clostridia bacterium]
GTEFLSRGAANAHCALIGKLSYDWVVSYMALLSIGAVLVPLDPDWHTEELADVVKSADCKFIISDAAIETKTIADAAGIDSQNIFSTHGGSFTTVTELIALGTKKLAAHDKSFNNAEIDPSKLALLVYTSGTTGKGKGVMLSQKAILSNVANALKILTAGEKFVAVLPPHHTFGSTISLVAPFCLGAEVYISSGVKYVQRELFEEKPDSMILVPLYLEAFYRKIQKTLQERDKTKLVGTMIGVSNTIRKVGIDLSNKLFAAILEPFGGRLQTIACGGAPMSPEIFHFFSSIGITLINGYGITECAPLISANRNKHIVPGTVGMPIPCDKVKIDSPDQNGEGEICVKGPNVMLGYYNDEEATAATIDADGYFHTGDIGKFHESGYLCITGRLKNLIILSNGKNVYPEEIEQDLSSIPGIEEIVVYEGVSKTEGAGNKIVAEIFPDENYIQANNIEDLQKYFMPYINDYNRKAVPYKKIGVLKLRNEPFPKNTLRKIVRFKIDKT